MSKIRRQSAFTIASIALAGLVAPIAASTTGAAEQGNTEACTPGYWKNHQDSWQENPTLPIPTSKTLSSAFSAVSGYPSLADDTFIEALSYGGGRGAEGAARLLLHHAVAAYLNAAYDDEAGHLQYPLARDVATTFYPDFDGIIAEVNAALASGDRDTMLALKDFLDGIANDLSCPLN